MRSMRLALVVMLLLSASVHAMVLSLTTVPEKEQIEAGEGVLAVAVGGLQAQVLGATPARSADETTEVEPETAKTAKPAQPEEPAPQKIAATEPTRQPVSPRAPGTQAAAPVELKPASDATASIPATPVRAERVTPGTVAPARPERAERAAAKPEDIRPVTAEPVTATQVESPVETALPRIKPAPPKPIREARAEPRKTKTESRKQRSRRAGAKIESRKGAASASRATRQARAGTRAGKATSNGRAALSNYQGLVIRKLRRAKRYPRAAQDREIEGTATLRFTIHADGSVSGARVVRSSGAGILDSAVRQMVARAAPFPRIPAEARRRSLTFTVPVSFNLRR